MMFALLGVGLAGSLPKHYEYPKKAPATHWTGYKNDFDKTLNFKAEGDEYVCGVKSYWRGRRSFDRRFKFKTCKWQPIKGEEEVVSRPKNTGKQTDWCNPWDRKGRCECRKGQAIVGMYSTHSNRKQDRRWRLYCGQVDKVKVTDKCSWTKRNKLRQRFSLKAPTGSVMTGMKSKHTMWKRGKRHEDREYKFKYCKVAVPEERCEKVKMIVTNFEITRTGDPAKVSGATRDFDNCAGSDVMSTGVMESIQSQFQVTSTWEKSSTFTKTFAHKIGATVSLEVSVGGEAGVPLVTKGEVGAALTTAFTRDFTRTYSHAKTRREAKSETTSTVTTFQNTINTSVKPHHKKILKTYAMKSRGWIDWKGKALCMKGNAILATEDVKGVWAGETVEAQEGQYKLEDVPCFGNIPTFKEDCKDIGEYAKYCPAWAKQGHCLPGARAASYMKHHCKKSCKTCVSSSVPPPPPFRRLGMFRPPLPL